MVSDTKEDEHIDIEITYFNHYICETQLYYLFWKNPQINLQPCDKSSTFLEFPDLKLAENKCLVFA